LVVQQAEAETDQVVKVGLKLFQELGERTKRLEVEVGLYRDMVIQLAAREGVDVPDFVKDDSGRKPKSAAPEAEEATAGKGKRGQKRKGAPEADAPEPKAKVARMSAAQVADDEIAAPEGRSA
jgi:hypothetical protein